MLMEQGDRDGGDARFLHELMNKFIEDTLLWTKADGSPGILDEGATPDHLAKLEAACREIEILPETFVGDEDDADDRARLLERRWRSPFSNDGTPLHTQHRVSLTLPTGGKTRRQSGSSKAFLVQQALSDDSDQA